jgi:redox-sensitive bicupin YhaK (pirin superfamily)
MRSINSVYHAVSSPIDNLITYNAIPGDYLSPDVLNPFIFLNHHGPQVFLPDNRGLPFGPHPHRGIETVTFILHGDIKHKDSGGDESIINAGGVQWMSAGRGLIHAETCSDNFFKNGGNFEVLQLWINLPSIHKMKDPEYLGLQKDSIPAIKVNDKVVLNLLSGDYEGEKGPFDSVTKIFLSSIEMKESGEISINIPHVKKVLLYVVKGEISIGSSQVDAFNLIVLNHDGKSVDIKADSDSFLILGYADPLNETIAAQGPFVMNTEKELIDAYRDYRAGKFGVWEESL